MKLAQCIILDLLKDYDPVPILPETCDFHFSGVQLLDQDNPTDDPSILYIGTTTQISSFDTEKLKDFCIICIGKKEDVSSYIENYQANLILIPENHSLASVVNTLYTGFHRILRWMPNCRMLSLASRITSPFSPLAAVSLEKMPCSWSILPTMSSALTY